MMEIKRLKKSMLSFVTYSKETFVGSTTFDGIGVLFSPESLVEPISSVISEPLVVVSSVEGGWLS